MVCYTNMENADLRECVNLNEGWIGFLHFFRRRLLLGISYEIDTRTGWSLDFSLIVSIQLCVPVENTFQLLATLQYMFFFACSVCFWHCFAEIEMANEGLQINAHSHHS